MDRCGLSNDSINGMIVPLAQAQRLEELCLRTDIIHSTGWSGSGIQVPDGARPCANEKSIAPWSRLPEFWIQEVQSSSIKKAFLIGLINRWLLCLDTLSRPPCLEKNVRLNFSSRMTHNGNLEPSSRKINQ